MWINTQQKHNQKIHKLLGMNKNDIDNSEAFYIKKAELIPRSLSDPS